MQAQMQAPRGERSRSPQQRSQPSRPPPPSAMTTTILNTLQAVKREQENAHRYVKLALTADEQGQAVEAKQNYERGLKSVNAVLAVNCDQIEGTSEDKEAVREIQLKLNKTKLEIEYRMQTLRASEIASPSAPPLEAMGAEAPPSYEESMSSPDGQYSELGDSIMSGEQTNGHVDISNASEIFHIPHGVQIFYISPEGFVSAPSYPSALKVFKFHEQEEEAEASPYTNPLAFMQVGDWFYPLHPGSSPALQSNYGAYLFPDVHAASPGHNATISSAAVGLMIPDHVHPTERQLFEDLLHSFTLMQHQNPSPTTAVPSLVPEGQTDERTGVSTMGERARVSTVDEGGSEGPEVATTSTKISKGLITAAEYISWGVEKGAEKASVLIKQGSSKLKTHLKPEDSERPVDPRLQTGIQYVRKGSHTAVQVSSYLVSKLGQATAHLAKEAAPIIRQQGEKMLPKSLKRSDSTGKSKVDSVLEVAASGLQGVGTVYYSLENAARALGKNVTCETVDVVSHKYGQQAALFTENALYSAGNLALTAHNAQHLGVKAVAKRAAKDTGKAVLNDLKTKNKPDKPPPPNGACGNNYM